MNHVRALDDVNKRVTWLKRAAYNFEYVGNFDRAYQVVQEYGEYNSEALANLYAAIAITHIGPRASRNPQIIATGLSTVGNAVNPDDFINTLSWATKAYESLKLHDVKYTAQHKDLVPIFRKVTSIN